MYGQFPGIEVHLPDVMGFVMALARDYESGKIESESIDVVEDQPQTAALTEAETSQFIDATLLPLLKVMMLVDNSAWSLFDRPT